MDINPSQRVSGERLEELLDRLIGRGDATSQPQASGPIRQRGADCPADGVWQGFAAHRLGAEESRRLIDHAAGCQRCGAVMNFWANILSEDQTPDESSVLARLSAFDQGWRERMTRTLCAAAQGSPKGAPGRHTVWPAVMAITGLVAASAVVFVLVAGRRSQVSPERLLAEAYTGHRIMDDRIPLAEYAPVDSVHHSRAAAAAGLSDSVPLLEARAAITQALMKAPEDPHWLLLQARSDLLNENYDAAIDTLKRLHANDPASVPVLTDLASAYTMRSRAMDVATDQVIALDFLEQAARLDPNNPVVLYNEALVLEDLFQYSNAMDAWKKFLSVERDKAWVADGKKRLAEIEAREAAVKARQSRLEPYLSSPEGMLHLARSPAIVSEYDEQLATIYLPSLLKAAFPLTPSDASPAGNVNPHPAECNNSCEAARTLLQATASSLASHHHDLWLTDLLAGPATPVFASAINSLAAAISDALYQNPMRGLEGAHRARTEFEASGNQAGILASLGEEIYSLPHAYNARECLAVDRKASSMLQDVHYPLIESKLRADEGSCEALQNDFASARSNIERSLQVSADAGYRIEHLRAFGFMAGIEQVVGNRNLAWTMNLRELQTYWDGNYPSIRLLLPYSSIADIEQTSSSRLYAALALRGEAFQEARRSGTTQEVVNANHFLLVKAEIRAGETSEAAEDLKQAEEEFTGANGNISFRAASADMGILLAEAYLARNDLAAAAAMLKNVGADVSSDSDADMEYRYASAAGHLALLQGRNDEAEAKLTSAVVIAERGYSATRGIQDRIDWIERAKGVYTALCLLRFREGRSPLEALAIWERYRILSSGIELKAWCKDGNLDCLEQPLDDTRKALAGETIIGTLRLDRMMLLWQMDDRGIEMHEVGVDPDRFDLLCHTFFEVLATPATSEASIHSYGARLANALLTPVAGHLDPHRMLVFDLDDSMEFLPVAALPWNGGYLGLQATTSTIHSILLAGRKQEGAPFSIKSVVIGASNPGDPSVPRLPEAKAEAILVAGFLAHPTLLVGDDASAKTFTADAANTGLVHFAGHTMFAGGGTRLLLAQPPKDGPAWIDARTFRSPRFANCRLVVLSACSTGKREERDSDDIQDIVQALTVEGAQQIVATHWDVDSAASVFFMKSFYSGLARGLTVPQALLQAESAVRTSTEYRHPYYWAPYYVIGMSKSSLKELFQNERSWHDPDRHHSATGFPGRNSL